MERIFNGEVAQPQLVGVEGEVKNQGAHGVWKGLDGE